MPNRLLFVLALLATTLAAPVHARPDPLPSWNDGPARQRIVGFVKAVTDPRSKDFVAPADRIAVFDNDGTLWSEQPMYFQLAFALDRVERRWPRSTRSGRRRNRSRPRSRATWRRSPHPGSTGSRS